VFEKVGVVPRAEFVVAQVGDGFADLGADVGFAQREIQADAAHALAFEGECGALFWRRGLVGQALRDRGFGALEVAGVHLRGNAFGDGVALRRGDGDGERQGRHHGDGPRRTDPRPRRELRLTGRLTVQAHTTPARDASAV
jgi:hypothetical protein